MNPLRCATHTVNDVNAAIVRFGEWLNYRAIERGVIAADLADAWGTPGTAGRRYAVCQPASGADIFLRFIEGSPVPDYRPIRSYGWAAIELCVQDVEAVNKKMLDPSSPFEIIGPPTRIAGLPIIYPMQVRGPDQETLYFTEIMTTDLAEGLPTANALIDKPFILVLACPNMRATADWFARTLKLDVDPPIAIRYSMISKAFDLPASSVHSIATAKWQGQICLEFDEYPPGSCARPTHPGELPPGVSVCTLSFPAIDAKECDWFSKPTKREGAIYGGRPVGVLKTPEGSLLEIIG